MNYPRALIKLERQEQFATALDFRRQDERHQGTIEGEWRTYDICPHCNTATSFTPHLSFLEGQEQEWLTCDECNAAIDKSDIINGRMIRKPAQLELSYYPQQEAFEMDEMEARR